MTATPTFTLVLRSTSYLIDQAAREQVLQAARDGARKVLIRTMSRCSCPSDVDHTRLIALDDVTGFLAHGDAATDTEPNGIALDSIRSN